MVFYVKNNDRILGYVVSVACVLLVLGSSAVWSGKLYKWVDKNGQTHYSQIPPKKNQIKDNSVIAEKAGADSIPVIRKGDYAYCGGIKLPGPLYKPKTILLGLGGRVETWNSSLRKDEASLTRQLRELSKRTRQNNKYSSRRNDVAYTDRAGEQRKKTARKIKEYRCAIAWADRLKDEYSDIKQEMSHDLKGAKINYQAKLDAAHRDCGFEPKDYANTNYNKKKSAWKKCMRPHERKIRSSERNLQKLRQQSSKLD